MTALERYNEHMKGDVEPDLIERLRFFLSLALSGQDWLDVEQFIDGVSQQLASRNAEVAKLRKEVVAHHFSWAGCSQQLNDVCEALEEVEQERDQLRDQVTLLREGMDAINTTGAERAHKWTGMSARDIARVTLDATEPKEQWR